MPIYEYQCENCGHQFDKLQKISDATLTTCPECSKDSLKKLISAPSFKLKGTGWYETDFKNNKKAEPKKDSTPKETKKADSSNKSTTSTSSD